MEKITDTKIIESVTDDICNYWKGEDFGNNKIFPGAQPTSIELKDLETIKTEGYICCPKLDGERYFLVIRKIGTILVNRNMEMFMIKISWNPYIVEKGAILDGELIDKHFVIHDAIEVLGKNVKVRNFDQRLTSIKSAVQMFQGGDIHISLKGFFNIENIGSMVDWMEENKIPNDGIVFYPIKGGIGYKSQSNFFKWKPPGYHTIDFLVRKNGRMIELITWASSREQIFKKVPFGNIVKLENFKPDGCIIEFNVRDDDFIPIKVRTDKPRGNNMYTVRKTILNAKENIKVEDLIKYFVPVTR